MTNTLHRRGSLENLQGDYNLFATPASGYNREGCAEQLRQFMRIVLRHKPVCFANDRRSGNTSDDPNVVIAQLTDDSHVAATFDNLDSVFAALLDLKSADLGISINITGLLDNVDSICRRSGIVRHSVEHSMGVKGRLEKLPSEHVLELNTMCGHGMVSFNYVKKMIDHVKLGKLTPAQGARKLAKPCTCGAFNTTRAEQLLERARDMS
jgi:hypothetical protein